jgi:hypothetical protein
VFIRPLTLDGTSHTRYLGIEKGSGDNYTIVVQYPSDKPANSNFNEFYIFAQISSASSDTFGMRMYDSSDNVSFDSGYKPLILKGNITIPPISISVGGGSIAYSGGTYSKPAYLAKTGFPVFNYSSWYFQLSNYGYAYAQSLHPYYSITSDNKIQISWNESSFIATYYVYASNFQYQTMVKLRDEQGINLTVTTSSVAPNWQNVDHGGDFMVFIDGAAYD